MTDDVDDLLARWDSMSEYYLAGRRSLIDVVIEHVAQLDSGATLIELGAGPGTTLRAIERAHPRLDLIGVDVDPVLRRLGNLAAGPGSTIRYVDADLSEPAWTSRIGAHAVDVVLAIQVLHYFGPDRLDELLDEIGRLLAPGGVLIHIDHVPASRATSDDAGDVARQPGRDPWSEWWASLEEHPQLADALRRRAAMSFDSAEYHPADDDFGAHLDRAGFPTPQLQVRARSSLLTIVRT